MRYIFKKELQSFFFSPMVYVLSAIFLFIFAQTFINVITTTDSSTNEFSYAYHILYQNMFYFIFLIPALTMKTFAEERRGNTEVLLLASPVSLFSVVVGKFLAVAVVFLFMTALSLVFPIIIASTGTIVWSGLICGYIGFIAWGFCLIAIGMLMSSFTENQVIAVVLGEACMLGLYLVDVFKENVLISNLPVIPNILDAISAQERFFNFALGWFSLADLVFYITFTCAALAFTMISIDQRRRCRG